MNKQNLNYEQLLIKRIADMNGYRGRLIVRMVDKRHRRKLMSEQSDKAGKNMECCRYQKKHQVTTTIALRCKNHTSPIPSHTISVHTPLLHFPPFHKPHNESIIKRKYSKEIMHAGFLSQKVGSLTLICTGMNDLFWFPTICLGMFHLVWVF